LHLNQSNSTNRSFDLKNGFSTELLNFLAKCCRAVAQNMSRWTARTQRSTAKWPNPEDGRKETERIGGWTGPGS